MSNNCVERLKNIIVADKSENPQKVERVIKSELLHTLNNYFDLAYDDLQVDICVNEKGNYILSLVCESKNLKTFKSF